MIATDQPASGIQMPEGTHLAYTIYHETKWWSQLTDELRPDGGRRSVNIAASAKGQGGGVQWEFGVVEHNLGTPALKLSIFDEGWEAFSCMRPFFDALASGDVKTLDDVVRLLVRLGAVDETEREPKDQ